MLFGARQRLYEWKATPEGKLPHAIARADGDPMAFASLWESWRSPDGDVLRTFAIITTEANVQMSTLHNRMPVILEPREWSAWLGEEDSDPQAMLRPAADDILRIWPVGKSVGNVRNDGPALLEPHRPPDLANDAADLGGRNPL